MATYPVLGVVPGAHPGCAGLRCVLGLLQASWASTSSLSPAHTYHKGITAHLSHTLPCVPPANKALPAPSVCMKVQQWLQLQGYLSMHLSGLIQRDGPIRCHSATPVPVVPLLAGLWNRADLGSQVLGQQGWPPPWVPSLLSELGQDGGGEENTVYPWISAKVSENASALYGNRYKSHFYAVFYILVVFENVLILETHQINNGICGMRCDPVAVSAGPAWALRMLQ